MKKPRWKHIRWIILALLLAGVCMFRFISGAGEFYACCIYPAVFILLFPAVCRGWLL